MLEKAQGTPSHNVVSLTQAQAVRAAFLGADYKSLPEDVVAQFVAELSG